jgi:hypothetical protein
MIRFDFGIWNSDIGFRINLINPQSKIQIPENKDVMVKTAIHPPPLEATSSFLIILMGSLGDVVRGLCIVSHIKNNLPKSRITWLVEAKWLELLDIHPHID